MRIKVNDKLLSLGIIIFILSGFLYTILGQTVERILLVISIFVLFIGVKKVKFVKRKIDVMDLFHTIFVAMLLVCGVYYIEITPIIYGVAMYITYFIGVKIFEDKEYREFSNKIYLGNYRCCVCVLIISLIMKPLQLSNYTGVYGNPNGMGIFAASFAALLISKIMHILFEKNKFNMQHCILYLVCIFMAIVSSCRTSLIAIGLNLFMCFIIYIVYCRNTKIKHLLLVCSPFILLIMIILMYQMGLIEIIQNSIINKFQAYGQRGDMLNGRSEIWKQIFQNAKWFSEGVPETQNKLKIASHNVYFGLMDSFGYMVAIVYFIFVIIVCVKSSIFVVKAKNCEYRFMPLTLSLNFVIISMTENYLMTYVMIMMYMCIPIMKCYNKEMKMRKKRDVNNINSNV